MPPVGGGTHSLREHPAPPAATLPALPEKVRDALRALVSKLTGAEKRQAQTAEGKLTAALEAASVQAEALQGNQSNGTMGETRYSAKAQRGWSVEIQTMENNRFERLRQFGDAIPDIWYAYTGPFVYGYENFGRMDYRILKK